MIKVNRIEVQTIPHYDNNDNCLGFLNQYESNDLRGQIAEQKASGYYLIFNDEKIVIQPNGKILNWASGLYDNMEKGLARIFTAQLKEIDKNKK